MTLIEIVQRVLSAINSQNVSTVDETTESEQVVLLVHTVLDDIYSRFPWLHLKERGNLEVTTTPNRMKIPDNVTGIEWVRYNKKEITYMEPSDFVDLLDSRLLAGLSNIDSIGAYIDTNPKYWTSFDDQHVDFDGYDGSLVASLTDCLFVKLPDYPVNNTDEPNLPEQYHIAVLHGTLAEAFRTLQGDDAAADRYEAKYARDLIRMRKWGSHLQLDPALKRTTWTTTYGRTRIGNASKTLRVIDTV